MKKLLFSIAIVAAGLLVASCGSKPEVKKELAGQKIETEQLSFVMPEGWKEIPTGADKSCIKKIRKGEGKIDDMKQFGVSIVTDNGPHPVTDPAERRDKLVENNHYVSQGDTILGGKQYFIAYKADTYMTVLFAKLKDGSDQLLKLTAEYSTDMKDQELLDIIDNITIK
ncbi:MAG: hypothetical protein IJ604_10835 [Prevotella sp.]|nr:hypothetical protein [Prevotella sp.]